MNDFHWLELGVVAATIVSASLLRAGAGSLRSTALLVGAWLLTGEIYVTKTNSDYSKVFASRIAAPRDWVDQATHGAHVTFLGQALNLDPNPLWLAEFWNRSIDRVDAIDGTARAPARRSGRRSRAPTARSRTTRATSYTLAGAGVRLAAPIVQQRDGFTLYRTPDEVAPPRRAAERVRRRLGDLADRLHLLPARRLGTLHDRALPDGVHGHGPAGPGDHTRRHGQARLGGRARVRPRHRGPSRGRPERRADGGARTRRRPPPVTVQVNMTTFHGAARHPRPRGPAGLQFRPRIEGTR